MQSKLKLTVIADLLLAGLLPNVDAQLAIPSDGSDGALVITSNTAIDLGQAVTGNWTSNNTATAGKGIYDSSKWALVFKYSSVNIASNATVTFLNHPTHTPVVWLLTNNVRVNGTLSLDGQISRFDPASLPEPGPGGFRGGALRGASFGLVNGSGFGPGGGDYSGFYSTVALYGNQRIAPLIGGSGGEGGYDYGFEGGAGGGDILIATSGTITVNGSCHADGGRIHGLANSESGGGIRLIANQSLGGGLIQASGPVHPGRIRLEANTVSSSPAVDPTTIGVLPVPLVIWLETNAATLKVVSVAALAPPADPRAKTTAAGDDLTIAATNAVAIVLQTASFPTNGTVKVYIKPRNGAQSILPTSFVSGNNTAYAVESI